MPSPSFSSISLFRVLRAERGRRKAAPQVVSHLAGLQNCPKKQNSIHFQQSPTPIIFFQRIWDDLQDLQLCSQSAKAVGSSQQDIRIFKKYLTKVCSFSVRHWHIRWSPDRSSQLVISVAWLLTSKKHTEMLKSGHLRLTAPTSCGRAIAPGEVQKEKGFRKLR